MRAPLSDDPRLLERQVRLYAQSRSVPFLILMVMGALLFLVLVAIAHQVVAAHQTGTRLSFWIWLGVLAATAAGSLYAFFFDPWGERLRDRLAARIYGEEGHVALAAPRGPAWRVAGVVAGLLFAACMVATALLTAQGVIPRTHVQPVSALYFVPFLIFLVLWQRPLVGVRWGLLWPALYALHAVLIAAGAPIVFTGQWKFLNMVIPVFGYGILAGVVGHLHSRAVLRRLRAMAHVEPSGDEGEEEA